MGKLTTYIIVMAGLMLLFYVTGIIPASSSTIFNLLLNPESIKNSPLDVQITLALQGVLAASIIVGFAVAGNIELGVMGVFAIFLMNMLWDFFKVYNTVYASNPVIALLVFSPVLLLFAITIIEWWRGRD